MPNTIWILSIFFKCYRKQYKQSVCLSVSYIMNSIGDGGGGNADDNGSNSISKYGKKITEEWNQFLYDHNYPDSISVGAIYSLNPQEKIAQMLKILYFNTNHSGNSDDMYKQHCHHFDSVCDYIFLLNVPEKNTWIQCHIRNFLIYLRDKRSGGKGNTSLTYHYLIHLYKYDTELVHDLIRGFVKGNNPVGCWKDVRNICHLIYEKYWGLAQYDLIHFCVSLINGQLWIEHKRCSANYSCLSNVAKWIPRENSKHHWLFILLSLHWYKKQNGNLSLLTKSFIQNSNLSIVYKTYRLAVGLCANNPPGVISSIGIQPHNTFYVGQLAHIPDEFIQHIRRIYAGRVNASEEKMCIPRNRIFLEKNTYYLPIMDISESIYFNKNHLIYSIAIALFITYGMNHQQKRILLFSHNVSSVSLDDTENLEIAIKYLIDSIEKASTKGTSCNYQHLIDMLFGGIGTISENVKIMFVFIGAYNSDTLDKIDTYYQDKMRQQNGISRYRHVYWNISNDFLSSGLQNIIC